MRLKLAADAVVLSEHHASQVPRFGLNALVAEVQLLRRDLELLRSQMARPTAAEALHRPRKTLLLATSFRGR